MQKRILAVLMVFCLIISTVLTGCANGTLVVDWTKPVAGMTPAAFEASHPLSIECGGKTVSYKVTTWTEEKDNQSLPMDREQSVFEAGHTYQVLVELQIPEGETIAISDIVSTTKGFLPGMTWMKDEHVAEVAFRFNVTDENAVIDMILSIAVTDPALGKTPEDIEKDEATVLFNGKKVAAYFSDWRIYDLKRSDDGETMKLDTSFEVGHYYSCLLTLDKPAEYSKDSVVIRSEMGVLEEPAADGKLSMRLFFDQLAYQEITPDIHVQTADVRSGMTVKEMNKLLKVTMGEVELEEVEYTWVLRKDGKETALTEESKLEAKEQTDYAVNLSFLLPPNLKTDDYTLEVQGGDYQYHTGLMTTSKDNQTYGRVRIVYQSEDLLPSQEEMSRANILVHVPELIGEEHLNVINKGITVSAMNKAVSNAQIQWGAYVGSQLYALDKSADLLDGLYTTDRGDKKVDYYQLTLNFPMIQLNADDVKLAVDCEGLKTSWVSFWQEEESGQEMAQVTILIDAKRIIRQEEITKGIQQIFLYVPELYTGMTLEEINARMLLMINGAPYTRHETVWTQGVDEEGKPVVLNPEDMLHWEEEGDLPQLVIRIGSGNVTQESVRRLNAGVFGVDPEKSPYGLTLDEIAKKVDLTVENLNCAAAFIKVKGPQAYTGYSVSFDPADYQLLWIDEYQTAELDIQWIEWRASEQEFNPETAEAEAEYTIWEGEDFEGGIHYAADLYASIPENRAGTKRVQLFGGPDHSLMSASTVIRAQEEGPGLVLAHLAVEPIYRDSEACLEHSFVLNEGESREATCSEEGLKVFYCENCDVRLEEVLPTTSHERVYNASASRAADCSHEGVNVYSCQRCGARWEETLEKLNHEMWINDAQSTPATCQHTGSEVSICAKCGQKVTRTLPKTNHDYVQTSEGTPATCEAMGTVVYACRNCGDSYSDYQRALGHKYAVSPEKSTAATCTEGGVEVRVCSTCGKSTERTTAPLGHDYQHDAAASKPATTTEEGLDVQKCSRCGDTLKTTVPKLPESHVHDFEELRIESTCTIQGTVTRQCKTCGHQDENVTYLPLASHNFDFIGVGLTPSSFEDGYNLVKCSVCGKEDRETVPAYGTHAMKERPEEGTAATCTHDGVIVYRCTHARCDYEERVSVPALAHNYVPGGNANGTHTLTCSACGASYTELCSYAGGYCSICGDVQPSPEGSEEVMG